ncbi:uncharacterized protein LAESUDRAFT_759296 [Laetiporus sulphureus 93-53]|uniref:DUF7918 domain-containing protein n=1 Tax=Laetiporus sulphureus 93-53 TaxID=1314785 RepID=A0A165E8H9_9APHY|nr:uncharacterized protein LAESUDRAFT_759296 [Laetiporus sulphureus 93-53]KZT06460.1 hypothetical protein LAESUDRAFT_759296 [Laetiporus sulphureus 93-53]
MHMRDCRVAIVAEIEKLTEYATTRESDAMTSCYIPSEAGRKFKIRFGNKSATDMSVHCFVNGQLVARELVKSYKSRSLKGMRICGCTVRPFMFSNVTLTDDDNVALAGTTNADNLGVIEIRVYRCMTIGSGPFEAVRGVSFTEVGPIHERTKKAGSHCVSLGESEATHRARTMDVRYIDDPRRSPPHITFRYNYRPMGMLIAQDIAPRPLPPPSETTNVHVERRGIKRSASSMAESDRQSKRSRTMSTPMSVDMSIALRTVTPMSVVKEEPEVQGVPVAGPSAPRPVASGEENRRPSQARTDSQRSRSSTVKTEWAILPIRWLFGSGIIDLTGSGSSSGSRSVSSGEVIDLTQD